ncbi:hypothetical protein Sjap_001157 [Stephania japonica]|uniref:Transmembrane 9 superfamily member n=1 Tax=Stephania japonica TaxID=461633 RepID=A0AAP0KLQ2_9MAGN
MCPKRVSQVCLSLQLIPPPFPSIFHNFDSHTLSLSLALSTMAMASEIRVRRVALLFIIVLAMSSLRISSASQSDHRYAVGEDVPLFVHRVGSPNNPSETYWFYNWPFCSPDQFTEKEESLWKVINNDRLANSRYELKFRDVKNMELLCYKILTEEEVIKFRYAVCNDFYFQMLYDNLPLWGNIGKVVDFYLPNKPNPRYYLFTHVKFDVLYNENQVIEVNALADPNYTVDITEDAEKIVKFTYSVFWNATSTPFEKRMEKYLVPQDLRKIKGISVRMFIFLIILLATVFSLLYTLTVRKAQASFQHLCRNPLEEDIFGYPRFKILFCAILGTGMQLLILALVGFISPGNRGFVNAFTITTYAITSVVAGFIAVSFLTQMEPKQGELDATVFLTASLCTDPMCLTFAALNIIAIYYQVTAAVPIGTLFVIFQIGMLVSLLLLILGGELGLKFRHDILASSDTRRIPLEIPPLAWYMRSPSQICVAGFVQCFAVVLQFPYLYESLWSHKVHPGSSILFIWFILLIIQTAMFGAFFTNLQLSAADRRWQWRSVLNGGSTSVFMFGYSLIFYAKSNMRGLMQLAFFVGYNACICYAFFLMLGTISFFASALFVHRIYGHAKLD